MNKKYKIGQIGEKLVTEYLRKEGYEILEKNFRGLKGEIDIIAIDEDELVFVEVKTRTNNIYGLPREAIDKLKMHRIYQTSMTYIYSKHLENYSVRYDAVEVYLNMDNGSAEIKHLKNIL